jgi:hypothetical protein
MRTGGAICVSRRQTTPRCRLYLPLAAPRTNACGRIPNRVFTERPARSRADGEARGAGGDELPAVPQIPPAALLGRGLVRMPAAAGAAKQHLDRPQRRRAAAAEETRKAGVPAALRPADPRTTEPAAAVAAREHPVCVDPPHPRSHLTNVSAGTPGNSPFLGRHNSRGELASSLGRRVLLRFELEPDPLSVAA